MIRYQFNVNEETGFVERTVLESFPEMDVLAKGIEAGRRTQTIKNGLLKAYEGKSQGFLCEVEDKWFKLQSNIQVMEKTLDELNNPVLEIDPETMQEIPLTEEEQAKINDKLSALKQDGSIESYEADVKERAQMEETYPWLVAFRGVETTEVRPDVTAESLSNSDVKSLIAHERNLSVRNIEDTVADLAKMNSLLLNFIKAIYGAMDPAAKGAMDPATKAVFDYAVDAFNVVQTRGDRQLAEEGTALIDKLFAREAAIADIIDSLKA